MLIGIVSFNMKIGIITLFPEMFRAMNYGIAGRAIENQLIELTLWNPRHFSTDPYKTVDDRPYGGGPGMLMKVQPLQEAILAAKKSLGKQTKVIYVTPQGSLFNQSAAISLSKQDQLIFLAGRYEGIDERIVEAEVDEEWSLGDYVLSGGELAIMVIIDVMTRLLPGAVGDGASVWQDSFSNGLLDYPHYTRPEVIMNLAVPEVLLSGDHQAIARWRLKQSLGKTWQKRPDLLNRLQMNEVQKKLLNEFIDEQQRSLPNESR